MAAWISISKILSKNTKICSNQPVLTTITFLLIRIVPICCLYPYFSPPYFGIAIRPYPHESDLIRKLYGMKTLPILLLWLFFLVRSIPVFGGSPDSLRQAIAEAKDFEARLAPLLDLTAYYCMRGHDSTLVLADDAMTLAEKTGDRTAKVRALILLGYWYHNKGQPEKSIGLHHRALSIARRYGVNQQLGPIYQNLALAYRRGFRQDSAFYYFVAAEKAFTADNNTEDIWRPYWGLAQLYDERGDSEKADEYGWKALELVEKSGNRADYGFMLFNLFSIYFRNDRFDRMADIRKKREAWQAGRKTGREIMEIPEHTSFLFFLSDDKADLENRLVRAISHYDTSGNLFSKAYCYEDLGDLYLTEKKPDKARQSYAEAGRLFQLTGDAFRRGRNLHQLYLTARQQGDFPASLQYLEAYQALADSMGNAETQASLNRLEVRYETEKKEQELRINRLELTQKTRERNLLLVSSILLALLAAGIFLALRQRLHTNKKLAEQEAHLQTQRILQLEQEKKLLSLDAMIEGQESERIRIAKDLHDGLGGLLTAIKSHFGGLNEPAREQPQLYRKTYHLIDGACVEVRRIAHNMMPGALMLSGLSGALEDLAVQVRENGLDCHLETIGLDEDRLGQTRSVMVYRILQELVNNILKHAEAREVLIQLLVRQGEMMITVEDDGCGFVPANAVRKKSLGLKNIEARVQFLKGEWQLDSVPGEGTTVNVRFVV